MSRIEAVVAIEMVQLCYREVPRINVRLPETAVVIVLWP